MELQNADGIRGVGADSWINQLKQAETANALQFIENNEQEVMVTVVSTDERRSKVWRPRAEKRACLAAKAKCFAWRGRERKTTVRELITEHNR